MSNKDVKQFISDSERLEQLGLPAIDVVRGTGRIVVGATLLIFASNGAEAAVILDPAADLDRRLIRQLDAELAPQPVQVIEPRHFMQGYTGQCFEVSVAEPSLPRRIADLANPQPLSPARHLSQLTVDGQRISPRTANRLVREAIGSGLHLFVTDPPKNGHS